MPDEFKKGLNADGKEWSVKKRTLSMKMDNKEVRMNPHYKRNEEVSVLGKSVESEGSSGLLKQAIDRGDLSYISEFLANKNRKEMMQRLSGSSKEALGVLLLEFVDQPLRNEALEMIREMISSIKDVGMFIKKLKGRMCDFSKLIYLKGKIDYLRFTSMAEDNKDEPEVVVSV
ncbi:hypothetical protein CWI42_091500 [Ordospora colligata]|uniref:Uncharacterized protein n=1 Tax=Ordospora colligata OC4 TaxID=1354746 RepID=A0A0B2UJ26_9MICR|nr:uncharacterized protein M896_091520 [Ordospora colligata OC4]KHN69224.1 hypothetical protein M896_091520 [Ordospora colligata OC4]TBU14502.1 hypothetical protein CWI40_091480 [Ordospora colligata]TBU14679.1 hypothetical protein CWI41_091510 [Ordospora colligata]TBU18064.1 hypothetical protein CWI42_091500 [Ordospora colligata]